MCKYTGVVPRRRTKDVARVNAHFEDRTELDILQEMVLKLMNVDPPATRTACAKLLDKVYINIFDYVDGHYDRACRSRTGLLKRCKARGFFPLKRAKSEQLRGLLKVLCDK